MTNFFTRMSQRSLGLAPTVRPILSPRYADNSFGSDAAGLSSHTETPQQMDEISLPPGDSAMKKSSGPWIADSAVSDPERPIMPASRAEGRRDQTLVSKNIVREMEAHPLLPEEEQNTPAELIKPKSVINKNKHLENSHADVSLEQKAIQDKPLLPLKPQLDKVPAHAKETADSHPYRKNHARPNQTFTTANQSNAQQEAPVIKVNIGRIDVRAVHKVPSPSKGNKVSSSPTLSLDDYLQQRRRGER
jgi:hypothetical protein